MSTCQIFLIAGEISGDMHGAGLVRALTARLPGASFAGIGGDRMADAGVRLLHHVREMSLVGVTEVVRHLPMIRRTLQEIRRTLETQRPALVILIDYPGFNLRAGAIAKRLGIPVLWYISPQVWAWGSGRIRRIAAVADALAVILPFEKALYDGTGLRVEYVGHPLLERVQPTLCRADWRRREHIDDRALLIGLLPGSRRQEIQAHLATMTAAAQALADRFPGAAVRIGRAPGLDLAEYQAACPDAMQYPCIETTDYNLLAHADLLIAASGTVTLEATILQTPHIIVYQVSRLTYWLGRLLVKVRRLGLANILAGRDIVPELLCGDFRKDRIVETADRLLSEPGALERMRLDLAQVRGSLGDPGASGRTASLAMELLAKTMVNAE